MLFPLIAPMAVQNSIYSFSREMNYFECLFSKVERARNFHRWVALDLYSHDDCRVSAARGSIANITTNTELGKIYGVCWLKNYCWL